MSPAQSCNVRGPDARFEQLAVAYQNSVLNTQTSLLQQQDALTATRGDVVSNLVGVYNSLGGGWQLRQGNNYVDEDIRTKMAERTNWGEYLESTEKQRQGDVQ